MSKREQVLSIEPKNEIHFKGPYNRVVTEYFHLKNPTDKTIAFKVKTTAPKRYCVRPNNGTIKPGSTVSVAIMLQPLTGTGTDTASQAAALAAAYVEKNKHKFMIQSVFATSDNGNADDLFKQSSPEDIMDSKFRCVFDDQIAPTAGATSGTASITSTSKTDSENEVAGGDDLKYGLANNANDNQSLNKKQDLDYGSITSTFSPAVGSVSSSEHTILHNGGDDDLASSATVASNNGSGNKPDPSVSASTSLEQRRLVDENRELRIKVQDLERAIRSSNASATSGTAAYNRFQTSNVSGSPMKSPNTSSSSKLNITNHSQDGSNMLDQFSTQLIGTVLVSLLIGFILGKIDFGFF
ncbi:hypothetical protein RDWZM_006418 [Blomia tropicalis]|uniref:MSP domain-containing protein n=1 Tax=Blomia tropicalis TaxID=40697 RepID=A0A9Q0M726_BLOTA|nr:hypothetical protein RDWZM_006418 [Blomia tropicalis]